MVQVSNWSRTQRCEPKRVARPRSEAELLALVQGARAAGEQLKVIGAGHSWSDIAMSESVLVSLDAMQGLVELDEAREVARVQAGTRLHRLNEELAARGYGLSIVGSVTAQSLAGVMSTGTHGSSLSHGNLSSLVVGLRLVTGAGELLVLDEGDPRLAAARVGLGALGIITEVTIRVEARFWLRETTEALPFEAALEQLPAIARSAEYVKLWWLPHTDAVMVFRYARSEPGRSSSLVRWLDTYLINKLVFPALLWLGARLTGLVPPLNRAIARTYLSRKPRTDRADLILSLAMPPRHRETEYALPLPRAAEALASLRARIEALGIRVNFIQELRFVKGDDAWMSPAGGEDTAQLGAYMAAAPGLDELFAGFEADMKALGARPHWGKEFRATPEEIRAMYPRTEEFVALAEQLDPEGVLANAFLRRLQVYR